MLNIGIIIASVFLALYINNRRMKRAMKIRNEKIPIVNNDCISAYEEAYRVIKPRLSTVRGIYAFFDVNENLGFQSFEQLNHFYPAIAMIRLCHLSGYEVEFRPMRTEHSPLEEGEQVSRMTSDEIKSSM